MRRKRYLWRVTATYSGGWSTTRHYQSEQAAREWAARRLDGYPEEVDGQWSRDPIEPAVRIDGPHRSDPITFPADQGDQS